MIFMFLPLVAEGTKKNIPPHHTFLRSQRRYRWATRTAGPAVEDLFFSTKSFLALQAVAQRQVARQETSALHQTVESISL